VRLERPGIERAAELGEAEQAQLDRVSGTFTLEHVPPGEYAVSFTDTRIEPIEERLHVAAGCTTTVEILVRKVAGLASITGVLRAAEPLDFNGAYILFRDNEGPSVRHIVFVEAPGPAREVAFEVHDVRPGEYRLTLQSDGVLTALEEPVVRAGDMDVVLLCERAPVRAKLKLVLHMRDAGSGEPLAQATFCYRAKEEEVILVADSGGNVHADLRAEPFTWMASVEGHAPRWGTDIDLGLDPSHPERAPESVVVELDPGWGTEFFLFDDDNVGVAGVPVLLDGEAAGTTDADGRLRVVLAARPERFAIDSDEWVVGGANVDPETQAMDEQGWGVHVYLERRE
jgi:hypothetical protein